MYYVVENGYRITGPMTLKDIITKLGSVQRLENAGFRIIPVH